MISCNCKIVESLMKQLKDYNQGKRLNSTLESSKSNSFRSSLQCEIEAIWVRANAATHDFH